MKSLSIKKSIQGAMLATAAGAMVMAGTGMASAVPVAAVEGTPTADYQMCGTVYEDPPAWKEFASLPSGAQGVAGVTVSAALYDSAGNPDGLFGSAVTGPGGNYCLSGSFGDALKVQFSGAYVILNANGSTATPPVTVNQSPWLGSSGTHIDAAVFNAHMHPSFNSAWGFYFTV